MGLDVHKETIAIAVARPRGGEVTSFGVIANRPAAVRRLLAKLSPHGQVLALCDEAGPCDYGLYRTLTELGHRCCVVAPGLVPRKPGENARPSSGSTAASRTSSAAAGSTSAATPR